MPTKKKSTPEDSLGLERIVFFSDAVIAIAITLLALDLKLPEIDPVQVMTEVPRQLAALRPTFLTFFISFVVIGIYWISHHRYFTYIKRYDVRLMMFNLIFLFFIICMPFVANLLGRYTSVPVVLILYSLAVAALGASMALIWWYAARQRFIAEELDAEEVRTINVRLYAAPFMFLLSVPFAFISSTAVVLVWWLSPLGVIAAMHLFAGHRNHKKTKS